MTVSLGHQPSESASDFRPSRVGQKPDALVRARPSAPVQGPVILRVNLLRPYRAWLPNMLPAYGGQRSDCISRLRDIPAEDARTPHQHAPARRPAHETAKNRNSCGSSRSRVRGSSRDCRLEGWVSLSGPASCCWHRSLSESRPLRGQQPRVREGHPSLPTGAATSLAFSALRAAGASPG